MTKHTKKKQNKMVLPFKQQYANAFANVNYINNAYTTYDGKWYNGLRIANGDPIITDIVCESKFIFNGDSVGVWIEQNLDKCIFIPATSMLKYAWYVSYDYDTGIFRVYIGDKKCIPVPRSKDPIDYFYQLKDISLFVPIVIANPIRLLKLASDKYSKGYEESSVTVAFPYYLWEALYKELNGTGISDLIRHHKLENRSNNEDVLILKSEGNKLRLLDIKDTDYLVDACIWDIDYTKELDPQFDQLIKDDEVFGSLADVDIIDSVRDIPKEDRKGYRDIVMKIIGKDPYFLVICGDITNRPYRYLCCLKELINWSKNGNIKILQDGGTSFTNGIKEDGTITLYDTYIKIKQIKYSLNIKNLLYYLYEGSKDLSDWSVITDIIEGEEEDMKPIMSNNDDNINMLKCESQETISTDDVEIKTEPKVDLEFELDDKIKIRQKVFKEFATELRFKNNIDIPKDILLEISDEILKDIEAGMNMNFGIVLSKISAIKLSASLTAQFYSILEAEFFLFSIINYNVLLFNDLGMYYSNISVKRMNDLMIKANNYNNNIEKSKHAINTIRIDLYKEVEATYISLDGDIITDTVYYRYIFDPGISTPSKALMLFKIPCKIEHYAFLYTEDIMKLVGRDQPIQLDNAIHFNGLFHDPLKVYNKVVNDIFTSQASHFNSIVEGR